MNKLLVANLKMNLTYKGIKNYYEVLQDELMDPNLIICPTALYLPYLSGKKVNTGCQNIFFEEEGAYTGEISPRQLKGIGVKYTLVGHSERRQFFGDTDVFVNKKMVAAFDNHLIPILCVGETSAEHGLRRTNTVLKDQIKGALFHIKEDDMGPMIIAYEPVWAIGTGVIPTMEEIQKACEQIHFIMDHYYQKKVKVLYGGSVNETNIQDILTLDPVDGVLVGGASVDAKKFLKLIEVAKKV